MKKATVLFLVLAISLCFSSCFLSRKMTLEEYMDKNKFLYDFIASTSDEEEMEMKFSARENDLVLTVRLKETVNNVEAVSDAMSKATVEQKAVYIDLLEEVRKDVPSAESVIIEFYDANNVLLVYEQFK